MNLSLLYGGCLSIVSRNMKWSILSRNFKLLRIVNVWCLSIVYIVSRIVNDWCLSIVYIVSRIVNVWCLSIVYIVSRNVNDWCLSIVYIVFRNDWCLSIVYIVSRNVIDWLWFIVYVVSRNVNDWWLSYWITHSSNSSNSSDLPFYLGIYGGLAASNTVLMSCIFIRRIGFPHNYLSIRPYLRVS